MSEDDPIKQLEKLFRAKRTRAIVRNAYIMEITALGLARACFSHIISTDLILQFRNLLYYVHQNYLILIKLMLLRSLSTSGNIWIQALENIINEKQIEAIKNGNHEAFLLHHTEIIHKIIENMLSSINGFIKTRTLYVLKNYENLKISKSYVFLNSLENMTPIFVNEKSNQKHINRIPYLHQIKDRVYTLVLDLDETLVHFADFGANCNLLIRPGCSEFLKELSKYYELVIFTAATQDYAD